jgi:hypothetical protein
MLRHICPGFTLEVYPSIAELTRTHETVEPQVLAGRPAWRAAERVLTYLWTGRMSARREGSAVVVVTEGDSLRCRITAEKNVAYFTLAKQPAICCAELWHRAYGLASSLSTRSTGPQFEAIRRIHGTLTDALRRVEMEMSAPRELAELPVQAALAGGALTPAEDTANLATEVEALLREFRQFSHAEPLPGDWDNLASRFLQTAQTGSDLHEWMAAASTLMTKRLNVHPALSAPREQGPCAFQFLRISADVNAARRVFGYEVYSKYLSHVLALGPADLDRRSLQVQAEILQDLRSRFLATQRERQRVELAQWRQKLVANPWARSMSDRLRVAVESFRIAQSDGRVGGGRTALFQSSTTALMAECMSELRREVEEIVSGARWTRLYDTADLLIKLTTDSLEGAPCSDERADERDKRMVEEFKRLLPKTQESHLNKIFLMRCQGAHPPKLDREWQKKATVKYVAGILGRAAAKDCRDLELTSLEASEVKLNLITEMTEVIRQAIGARGASSGS